MPARFYKTVTFNDVELCAALGCTVELDGFEMDPPETVETWVDVPGRANGPIDMTEALAGYPTYGARTMAIRFIAKAKGREAGESLLSSASQMLHGKRGAIQLGWDPGYTYTGRVSVGSLVRNRDVVGFTMTAKCEPFKLKQRMSRTVDAAGGAWFYFESGRMPVVPVWTVYTSASIRKMGSDISYELGRGTYSLPDLLFTEGSNGVYIYAAGTGGEERLISSVASEAVSVYANVQIGDLMWVERPTNGRVRVEYDWKDL